MIILKIIFTPLLFFIKEKYYYFAFREVRVVFCRSMGGFTDTMASIHRCLQYAITNNRMLVIDTSYSGLHDAFAKYFVLQKNLPIRVELELTEALKQKIFALPSTQPFLLHKTTEQKMNYNFGFDNSGLILGYINPDSKQPTFFDLTKPYDSQLLIYQNSVGFQDLQEIKSLGVFTWFRVKPTISNQIISRLEHFNGKMYESIHVRCTDYFSDYKTFFEKIKPEITSTYLLICSDRQEVIEYGMQYFTGQIVLSTNSFSSEDNAPLHDRWARYSKISKQERFKLNIDLLVDLCALSGASKYHRIPITKTKGFTPQYSGFSNAAFYLHHNQHERKNFFGI
ncbi:MAG: hypothetical protein QM538_05335 [Methylacidiphilales bacterium]|nr:hypothetical protein [Candidatus Methylacidiphilales bacterium]